MARFVLADRLNKTLDEINTMSMTEFNYWFAYLEIQRERSREAMNRKK